MREDYSLYYQQAEDLAMEMIIIVSMVIASSQLGQ
jgi:hypothetical protein